ncbi:methyltransferase family protein [Spartinivicinus poritis]|uniref:Isoprenylcysteine carboxylmethyltransferase family protein n=1 Tax=Spartinivicinus poritis TaxID=2994640 RepID=A0ABT5UBQ5_9GAMM|nr:isoprenylcysteine carboxylmethyltransferase family protein [Spartinivicinus sp. A2-2]MDE1463411.1 isoprenylcysteine carboxylmethyltransferase family protein [Spartinivicinus sp. A2-2]
MYIVDTLFPSAGLTGHYLVALVLAMTGIFFIIAGVLYFYQAKTTVNPITPEDSSSLVTHGIYRITRSPMYVGFAMLLVGWSVLLSNVYSLLLVFGFICYLNRYQIKPEEQALENLFGEKYLAYKKRVSRWL